MTRREGTLLGRLCLCMLGAGLLTACAPDSTGDLQQWMVEQRNSVKPRVETIPEPTRFVPQAYSSEGAVSPFSTDKLSSALKQDAGAKRSTALVTPELNRPKEPLEALPLDTMSMVGLLDKGGRKVALVKAGALLYQVRQGNYLGQNYGRVTAITDKEITLREIVQDAAGEWIERTNSLLLQEETSK